MVVVAMEEARFPLPMQGRVRGIQIHSDGSRAFRWDSRKSVTSSSSMMAAGE